MNMNGEYLANILFSFLPKVALFPLFIGLGMMDFENGINPFYYSMFSRSR